MPLTKKDAPGNLEPAPAPKAKAKAPSHPGDLTPSAAALAEVGPFEGEPGSEAALKHGERYQAAKRKRRFGH